MAGARLVSLDQHRARQQLGMPARSRVERPQSVGFAEGERECLIANLAARVMPADADDRLPVLPLEPTDEALSIDRGRVKARVRLALERWRTAKPRLRLAYVHEWSPAFEEHLIALARRHARELIERVRAGGADDYSVPIEVDVILEICGWFETLGKLKERRDSDPDCERG